MPLNDLTVYHIDIGWIILSEVDCRTIEVVAYRYIPSDNLGLRNLEVDLWFLADNMRIIREV